MTEFNSNSFLIELDSFGRPPPPQNIYEKSETRDIASKLDVINMQKQKKMMGDMLPPSENGMVKLGNVQAKKQHINPEDAEKWRNDVLAMSRPKAPGGFGVETPETAREYARQIRYSTQHYTNHSDSDEDQGTRSSSASNSLPSPPGELSSPYLRIKTDHRHERKSSDYSSASSHKSQSPPSQSSYSDYASLYKSQTTTPSPRVDSPTKSFNQAFRNSSSVPVVTVNTRPRFSPVSQKTDSKSAPKTPAAPNFGYGPSLTQQVRVNAKPPSGRFGSGSNSDLWRRIEIESNSRDRKLEELTKKLHENLVMDKKHEVGSCAHCRRPMYDTEDRYTVQESTYHSACFVCEVCGKELKDQQFYLNDGRFYCKQDYFTEQMVQQRDTLCAACKLPITETVLSTLHRHFHPKCFRCTDCYKGLDGIPFSADTENQPFCLQCYHNRYAPRCGTCKRPITPDPETGETTRVVALNNSYHESCYCCEGCNASFDAVQKCYPLDGHLLCRNCHIHWAKTRSAPITDL